MLDAEISLIKDVVSCSFNSFNWIKIEILLLLYLKAGGNIIFFSNLPPIFKLKAKVTLFLQNRYLVDDFPLSGFNLKSKLRLVIERFWFRFFKKNVDNFVVQTKTMKRLLNKTVNNKTNYGRKVIKKLFFKIKKNPQKYINISKYKNSNLERIICDYIAGMTDRYAINLYNKIK